MPGTVGPETSLSTSPAAPSRSLGLVPPLPGWNPPPAESLLSPIWAGSPRGLIQGRGSGAISMRATCRFTSPGPSSELQTPVPHPVAHVPARMSEPPAWAPSTWTVWVPPAGLPGRRTQASGHPPRCSPRGTPLLSWEGGFPTSQDRSQSSDDGTRGPRLDLCSPLVNGHPPSSGQEGHHTVPWAVCLPLWAYQRRREGRDAPLV